MLILGDYHHQEIRDGRDYSGIGGSNFKDLLLKAGVEAVAVDLWPRYVHPSKSWNLLSEPTPVKELLEIHKPNIVVLLGGLVQKVFLGVDRLKDYRGSALWSDKYGVKVLSTYHPDNSIKEWGLRPFIVQDLRKAKAEDAYPELRRPKRRVHILETPQELEVIAPVLKASPLLAADVETKFGQITCIGLAISPHDTYVIQLRAQDGEPLIWSLSDEVRIWKALKDVLEFPHNAKVMHNAAYDLQYLIHHGVYVRGDIHDTMFMAHSRQPEWPKSLGFLGSLYTSEGAWKNLRNRSKEEGKDDE